MHRRGRHAHDRRRDLDRVVSSEVAGGLDVAAGDPGVDEWCREHDVTFVLNPAPASEAVVELAGLATYLTPNEGELEALGAIPDDVVIIETRGSAGAVIHAGGQSLEIPAPAVETLDSTGAGDCFNGVFAAGLLEGMELPIAVRRAVVASALSVTRAGARNGMPRRDELEAAMTST